MALSTATSVALPTGRTTMVIFPGGNGDYQGSWPAAATALETLWNTGVVSGHKWGGLHAIVGSSWGPTSYYNTRLMWQGFAGQQFISLPSMFPQFEADGVTPCTYDKALAGNYDALYTQVAQQIVADWPYAVIRIGQEVDGNWFWWGRYYAGNGATEAKIKAVLTRIYTIFRNAGFKGWLVPNAGNFNGFDIGNIVPDDPALWDAADCDCYATGNAGSGGSATNQAAAWTQAQLPMIQNTIRAAAAHGKPWGMFETSPNVWRYPVNGSADNSCHDDAYFWNQLHSVIMDTTQPAECRYLTLHNGNDYGNDADRSTIQRRDTLWVTTSRSSTDWHDDPTGPASLLSFRGDAWTESGLTRTVTPGGGGGGTGSGVIVIRRAKHWRRAVPYFGVPAAGLPVNAAAAATLTGTGALAVSGGTAGAYSTTANLSGAGGLTAAGGAASQGSGTATLAGTGGLTATPAQVTVGAAAAAFGGGGTLIASGVLGGGYAYFNQADGAPQGFATVFGATTSTQAAAVAGNVLHVTSGTAGGAATTDKVGLNFTGTAQTSVLWDVQGQFALDTPNSIFDLYLAANTFTTAFAFTNGLQFEFGPLQGRIGFKAPTYSSGAFQTLAAYTNYPTAVNTDGAHWYGFRCRVIDPGDGTLTAQFYQGTVAQLQAGTLPLLSSATVTSTEKAALAAGGFSIIQLGRQTAGTETEGSRFQALTVTVGANGRDTSGVTNGDQMTAANTGYSPALLQSSLTQSGTAGSPLDVTYTTANQTIRDTEFHGMVKVNAAGVTFRNCIFHGHNSAAITTNESCVHADQPNISGALFEDCTFVPDYPSLWVNGINGHGFSLRRCNLYNVVDGAGVYDTSSTTGVNVGGANANPNYATNTIIEYSYIHDLLYYTPDPNHASDNQTHNDGVQIQGGSGTIVRYTNIQAYYGTAGNYQPAPNANPSPSGYTNVGLDCIYLGGQSGSTVTNCDVHDCFFGGGYIPLNLTGGSQTTTVGSYLRNHFDGAAGAAVTPPETILLKAAQTATTGDGTADKNTFTVGTYAGQEITVRHNG